MSEIATSIVVYDLKISWDYPIDNGNSVKQYVIKIKAKNGTFLEFLEYCDGSLSEII